MVAEPIKLNNVDELVGVLVISLFKMVINVFLDLISKMLLYSVEVISHRLIER